MLEFYHRLARRLYAWRQAFWLLCGLAVALFAVALLRPGPLDGQALSLAAITLLIWSVCVLTLAYSFMAPLPTAGPDAGWFRRIGIRVRRGLLWLMALALTALTGLVLLVSLRFVAALARGWSS